MTFVIIIEVLFEFVGVAQIEAIERDQVIEAFDQVEEVLEKDLGLRSMELRQWAFNDDTYDFVAAGSDGARAEWLAATTSEDALASIDVDTVAIVDVNGDLVFGVHYGPADAEELLDFVGDLAAPDGPLSTFDEPDGDATGFVSSPAGPLLVASRPVLDSAAAGPAVGTMVFAQLATDRVDSALTSANNLISANNGDSISVAACSGRPEPCPDDISLTTDDGIITASGTLGSLSETTGVELRVTRSRTAAEASIGVFRLAELMALIVALIGALVGYLAISRWLGRRLTRIETFVTNIGGSGDYSARLSGIGGSDELAALADDIDDMLGRLEQARAEKDRSEERLILATEASRTGVWSYDSVTGELYVSPIGQELMGVESDDRTADQYVSRLHPDDVSAMTETISLARTSPGQVVERECRWRRPDGSWRWVQLRAVSSASGDETRLTGTLTDVSDHRRRALALAQATMIAEEASEAKSRLVSRVSHDLRTPLNAVLGFAQLLQASDLDPQDGESVELILRAGHQLVELIDELLDSAKIEAGRIALDARPVPVAPIVEDAVTIMGPEAGQRDVSIETDIPEEVFITVDPARLRQALLNVLSNSVKYNVEGGQVAVSGFVDDQELWLNIVDTGRGISTEVQERAFDQFDRLDADDLATRGTGIGLSITKRLVELMHGHIRLTSRPGKGTTVTITFPLSTSAKSFGGPIEAGREQAREQGPVADRSDTR